jgi:hypothetical protein
MMNISPIVSHLAVSTEDIITYSAWASQILVGELHSRVRFGSLGVLKFYEIRGAPKTIKNRTISPCEKHIHNI